MKALPEVSDSDLQIWDDERGKCGGYLNKKASQSSAFSRGKWQKRWFVIDTEIEETENYSLQYFHAPDDKSARQSFPLARCTIKIINDTSFVLMLSDDSTVSLSTDTTEVMKSWIQTLEKVITVANMREKLMSQFDQSDDDATHRKGKSASKDAHEDDSSQVDQTLHRLNDGYHGNAHALVPRTPFPMLRLDVDILSMPPTSAERLQFIDLLAKDLAQVLEVDEQVVQVLSLRSAPGKDWLTLVEFNFNFNLNDSSEPDFDDDATHVTAASGRSKASQMSRSTGRAPRPPPAPAHTLSSAETFNKRKEMRHSALLRLLALLQDGSSALYMGFMTSRVDPTYTHSLQAAVLAAQGDADLDEPVDADAELFSNDARILSIMHTYHSVAPEEVAADMYAETNTSSCFLEIQLFFEDRIGTLKVLNPSIFPDRDCVVHVCEVQQALGMLGTLQELHLRPTGLLPRHPVQRKVGVNPSGVIPFEPSVRHGDLLIVSCSQLLGCNEFDVQAEDDRDDILNSLSKEEMGYIKDTYQQLELFNMTNAVEGSGVNIVKYEEIMQARVVTYSGLIEDQYRAYIAENNLQVSKDTPHHHAHYIEEELRLVLLKKQQYLQSLQEVRMRCVLLLQASNVFGTNHISFTEFILIETWWLRCAIHPERAHLF